MLAKIDPMLGKHKFDIKLYVFSSSPNLPFKNDIISKLQNYKSFEEKARILVLLFQN